MAFYSPLPHPFPSVVHYGQGKSIQFLVPSLGTEEAEWNLSAIF